MFTIYGWNEHASREKVNFPIIKRTLTELDDIFKRKIKVGIGNESPLLYEMNIREKFYLVKREKNINA